MPQSQSISPETLQGFLGLTEQEQVVALGSMSEGTKAQLLGALKGASGGPPPDARSAQQVAADQIINVGRGIPQAITNIPQTAIGVGRAMLQSNPMERDRQLGEMAVNAFQPVTTVAKGGANLLSDRTLPSPVFGANVTMPHYSSPEGDPSNPAWPQAAQGAGANLGGTLLGAGIGKMSNAARSALMERAPEVYQKALQPSPSGFSTADIKTMVNTGLKEEIPVSNAGLNKLDDLVDELNKSIEADIAKNPKAPISPTAVANRLGPLRARVEVQTNPEADVSTVEGARAEFLRQHQTTGQQPRFVLDREGNVVKTPALPPADVHIPAEEAQAIKKGTYRQVKSRAYGEQGSARVESEKGLARGLKEELEQHFPEIKGKNAREGSLFDLRPELQKEVNRMGNNVSITKTLSILKNPAILSRIAIMMYKAGVPSAVAQARIAAFTAGLAANTQPQQ